MPDDERYNFKVNRLSNRDYTSCNKCTTGDKDRIGNQARERAKEAWDADEATCWWAEVESFYNKLDEFLTDDHLTSVRNTCGVQCGPLVIVQGVTDS